MFGYLCRGSLRPCCESLGIYVGRSLRPCCESRNKVIFKGRREYLVTVSGYLGDRDTHRNPTWDLSRDLGSLVGKVNTSSESCLLSLHR